jgi:glycosyltransferase involved in cell wall biosynthesis
MSKIKVAFLIDTIVSDTAGTEKQLIETIRRIDRNSFEPFLICLYSSGWLENNTLPCPAFVLGYRGFLKINFPKVLGDLILLIRDYRFNVVQTFFEESIFVGFLGARMSGVSCRLLSSRRDVGLGNCVPWYHGLYEKILPMINKGFDGVIANSRMVKEYVKSRERIPGHKVKVIYNGVAMPESYSKPRLMCSLSSGFWIVILANLRPVKRIDVFLRSLDLFRATHSDFTFGAIIMGEGSERGNLERLAGELNLRENVYFLGTVSKPGRYLQYADLGVLCSDREGFSNAILEYMSYSLPVIATNVGGNAELVDESNGICIPSGDPEALARAIARLANDRQLRESMGRRSKERVTTLYSWERALAELQGYYRELMTSAGNSGAGNEDAGRQRDGNRRIA